MRRIVKAFAAAAAAAVLLLIGAGLYIGNRAFEEFRAVPWDAVLGMENESRRVEPMTEREEAYGWEHVSVRSSDGTSLAGTYIEDANGADETVILLHGLYHNRAMCLPYVPMYRNLGWNVLLVDLRGHGESGGRCEWGVRERDDLAAWVRWLKERNPSMTIGLHGISLGAAMALLYAGSDGGRDVAFVAADSSYGNIVSLGREKLAAAGDEGLLREYDVLRPFFEAAMWYHTGAVIDDIEPARAAAAVTCPVLFIHGGDDRLVPPETAQALYDACPSRDKELYIVPGAAHAAAIDADRDAYEAVVTEFIHRV